MNRLLKENRIFKSKSVLRYRKFADDFPYERLGNIWTDTRSNKERIYVVQTNAKVVERCMHMTTEAGDLVLDITCGSGVTPVVAEKWGRRWIAVDISRVPMTIARQRLLTQVFDWYQLENEDKGPKGGFVYKSKEDGGEGGIIGRISLGSISRNEKPSPERIMGIPEVDSGVQRVCGPFTVESTIQPAASLDLIGSEGADDILNKLAPEDHIEHMTSVLLQAGNVALAGEPKITIKDVGRIDGGEFLHSKCTCVKSSGEELATAIAFGPKDTAVPANLVQEAATEAMRKGYRQFFIVGFGFDATARTAAEKMAVPTMCVEVAYDMAMDDLLTTSQLSEVFTITGTPDVTLEQLGENSSGEAEFRVKMNGLDTYGFESGRPESVKGEELPCWILDTDYNGLTFYGRHFFTPGISPSNRNFPWRKIRNAFKKEISEDSWNSMLSTTSPPFRLGEHRRIAVMAIDLRGNSLMAIRSEEDAVKVGKGDR